MASLPHPGLPGGSGAREQRPTILIVDDLLDGRMALQTVLAGQGYTLAFAENGPEGLTRAADLVPDLILLDVMMPGMDGLEVCRRVRANPLLAEVPVIMITALDDRETRLKGIEAGADDFLPKKFDSTELRARVRTITRLNRYRRLLRERAKFERVVELAPNGLLIVDGAGTIVMDNPAMRRMLGANQMDDLLGKQILLWVEAGHHDRCVAELKHAIANSAYFGQFEIACLRMDGTPFPAEIDIGHFVWDEAPMAQVVVRDITNRRRLEAQLLQAQKLESIGRLAGGVAHDFNNQLTAIIGYTELALDTMPPDAREREDLAEITKAAQSAATLTQQLLAFARKQPIEPRIFNPNDLLQSLDKLLRRLIGEDITLITVSAPDLGLIKADPGQIQQVLVNLVVNARDAMPEGGTITIETANVLLDSEYSRTHIGVAPGQYIMLVVSDTGLGMDEAIKRYIFEPFFTTKMPGHGTGLGLATCYGTIKQHGGTIEVYSEPHQGTAFKIYLPRVEGVAETLFPTATAADALPRGSETVLLVEDEAGVRAFVARVLRDLGYTVMEAADGNAALRVLQEHAGMHIQLLLTDLVLPYIGGKPLAERLAIVYPKMRVLFMSGYTENSIVHHGRLDQGVAFLAKPFSAAALARKVREVLDG